ncbi:hypothetical protein L7F22_037470 [Adiantum nelumboides]|nr:hypothetical protein [Adiantum nelumboides]
MVHVWMVVLAVMGCATAAYDGRLRPSLLLTPTPTVSDSGSVLPYYDYPGSEINLVPSSKPTLGPNYLTPDQPSPAPTMPSSSSVQEVSSPSPAFAATQGLVDVPCNSDDPAPAVAQKKNKKKTKHHQQVAPSSYKSCKCSSQPISYARRSTAASAFGW